MLAANSAFACSVLANKDDTDSLLAQKMASNKQCSIFVLPDDEYRTSQTLCNDCEHCFE